MIKIINLGDQPPSNSFIEHKNIKDKENTYPLNLLLCNSCSLVQLDFSVNPNEMYSDYVYLSSSSKVLKKHLSDLAKSLFNYADPNFNDLVIDIGCNDGALLDGYKDLDVRRLGIEPSSVAEIARKKGLNIENMFFNVNTAKKVLSKYGKAKIITGTNVFAHVSDQNDFLEGINLILEDDGIFVIEVPHVLDMLENNLFDTIYHEHIFYYSLTSLKNLLKDRGFKIFHVEKLKFGPSGPPIRVFICKEGSKYEIDKSVNTLMAIEQKNNLSKIDPYIRFRNNVWQLKDQFLETLDRIVELNGKIIGYGAPAKGNTILNTFGIGIQFLDCIVENNELKAGLYTPGTHVPIKLESSFDLSRYKHALLLSWNLLNFFLDNSPYIKNGGKFIMPIPSPKILP